MGGDTGWIRMAPPTSNAPISRLQAWVAGSVSLPCLPPIRATPPDHQSPARLDSRRQAALFTGAGPSTLEDKWPGRGSDLDQLRVGPASQVLLAPAGQGHTDGLSASASPPRTLALARHSCLCCASHLLGHQPLCRDEARLVMAQRGRPGSETGEGKGAGLELVGMLLRL